MKFQAMRVRIGRVVLERPADEGLTASALSEAVQSELALRLLPGSTTPPPTTRPIRMATPLTEAIAHGIATRLGGGGRR